MVSAYMLLSYLYWTITFTVHTDAPDKQLGAVISQNNKTIASFPRTLSKPQGNYTMTEKEHLVVVECLNQSRRIIFGYEIKVLSYHKNLVYVATLSEYQRIMHCQLII